jgi:hypothetical protein
MTNLQLQTWLHTNIGVATDQDLQVLRDATTKAPFTHSTMFAQEAAKLHSLFVLMAQLNAPISNYEQICQLYDNVQHLPHVLHAVRRSSVSERRVKSKVKRFNSTVITNYVGYYTQNL